MNALTIVLFLVAAWNPARAFLVRVNSTRTPLPSVAVALAVALAVGLVGLACGRWITDLLDVSPPTMRLAGAIVVGLLGARTLVVPVETWTTAHPVLAVASVELAVAALAVGAPGWRWWAIAGLSAGLLLSLLAARLPASILPVLARGFGILAVVMGVIVGVVAVQTV